MNNWKECIEQENVKNISIDKGKINSLINTANARIIFLEKNSISEDNANFIFEGYYTSLIEISHAILISNGFKCDNHICLGYFIRDYLNNENAFLLFDDCRFKRNSLVYYGKQMEFVIANESISKIKKLIELLNKKYMIKLK